MLSATHEAMLCPTMVNRNEELVGSGATYMKAKVFVSLKPGVLDPQGKAIQHSVELLGFSGIADVRQGKYFEIALQDSADQEQARESVTRIAREVLSNPIIEDYRVEIEA
jgi:phosphoribosylformylglycinamidine synthase PurS subunit